MIGEAQIPICTTVDEGQCLVVRLDLALPFDHPVEVWQGVWMHGRSTRVATSWYIPGFPTVFHCDCDGGFADGEEVTLAVTDRITSVLTLSWRNVPWIWEERYRIGIEAGGPQLTAVGSRAPTAESVPPMPAERAGQTTRAEQAERTVRAESEALQTAS